MAVLAAVVATGLGAVIVARRTPQVRWVRRHVRQVGEILLPLRTQVWLRVIKNQGRLPRLRSPETFSDLVARNLLGRPSPLMVSTTDKVAVRPWVAALVGAEILPTRFLSVASFDDIDLAALPDAVVLKASHGSGMTLVVTGQSPATKTVVWDERVVVIEGRLRDVDPTTLRAITEAWLATDYSRTLGERQYATIPRRILAEEYLGSPDDPLLEYGIYCVKGNVVYAQVCLGQELYRAVDRSYRPLSICGITGTPPTGELPPEPRYFSEMVRIAETLSAPFDCVRVDLHHTDGRMIFSEVTHTTLAGRSSFDPPEFSDVFGRFWRGDHTIPETFYR